MAAGAVNSGSCLHLVVHPGAAVSALCASQFREGDSVLFLDNGVMALAGPQPAAAGFPFDHMLFAEADVAARGLLDQARRDGLLLLPDRQFADLLSRHSFCLTWK